MTRDTNLILPTASCDAIESGQERKLCSVLALYQKVALIDFFDHLQRELKLRRRNGVFTLAVLIWLMVFQRLHDKGTLQVAVQQVIRGLPACLMSRPCKRLRERKLSSHTGGYNQARQNLPLEVVERVSDHIFEQLMRASPETLPRVGLRLFLLDGSTLMMPHTAKLAAAYPPSRNQHGESHWPLMRVLVAHELSSGVAMRPHYGPANGPKAVSEQRLMEESLERLPTGSVVLGDQNFGVFSVAWAAQQRDYAVLQRLTSARAQRAFGLGLCSGTDRQVEWRPSRWDRTSHPQLPAEACVRGRLVVRKVYPSDGSGPLKLYLFTTLDLPAEEILKLYGQRWNVETDLRSLKKTIRLEMLRCQTPAMVAKELVMAVTAYNLVRAAIGESARSTQQDPRRYSFSHVQDVLNTWLPYLATLSSEIEYQTEYERMMKCVAQCKLYKRKKPSSYPREVWGRPRVFPSRKPGTSQKTDQVSASRKADQS